MVCEKAGLFAQKFGNDENEDGAAKAATEKEIDHRVAGGGDGEGKEGKAHDFREG